MKRGQEYVTIIIINYSNIFALQLKAEETLDEEDSTTVEQSNVDQTGQTETNIENLQLGGTIQQQQEVQEPPSTIEESTENVQQEVSTFIIINVLSVCLH